MGSGSKEGIDSTSAALHYVARCDGVIDNIVARGKQSQPERDVDFTHSNHFLRPANASFQAQCHRIRRASEQV
jgi:hypothetical protein